MKKLLVLFTFFCSSVLVSGQASAIALSLIPSSQNVEPESIALVTINISGLSDGGPPSLGALDIALSFNPGVLSFQLAAFGPFLGDEGLGEVITNVDTSLPGIVKLNEISLLEGDSTTCIFCSGPFLDNLQEDTFPLANLTFGTSSDSSVSAIGVTNVVLSDALGNVLPVTTIRGAEVNVVPEPSTIFLLTTGLVFLAGSRFRSSRNTRTRVE